MDISNEGDVNDERTLSLYDIETLPGNTSCVDCEAEEADWASLGFGVLICLQCAGNHRSLGVHISLVRSLNLDSWSSAQLSCLKHGGNDNFREHLSSCLAGSSSSSGSPHENQREVFESRYNNPWVLYYREILQSKIDNREPEEYCATDFEDQVLNTSLSSCKRDDVTLGNPLSGPTWGADKDILECLICKAAFSFLMRRHHCRRCGKCVCSKCAPAKNSRPIMEWGLRDSVRHCKLCYMSPIIKWSKTCDGQSPNTSPIRPAKTGTPTDDTYR